MPSILVLIPILIAGILGWHLIRFPFPFLTALEYE